MTVVGIQKWFMIKSFTQGERYAIQVADALEIKKETEKALLLQWSTEFGKITRWIPKSVCVFAQ